MALEAVLSFLDINQTEDVPMDFFHVFTTSIETGNKVVDYGRKKFEFRRREAIV